MMQLSLVMPDTVDEQVAALTAQIDELKAKRDAVQRTRLLACCFCQHQAPVGTLTYIQTHWYEQPHGCTGGDMWHQSEGQYVCPGCGNVNRLIRHHGHEGVDKYKYFFAKVEDTYDR